MYIRPLYCLSRPLWIGDIVKEKGSNDQLRKNIINLTMLVDSGAMHSSLKVPDGKKIQKKICHVHNCLYFYSVSYLA